MAINDFKNSTNPSSTTIWTPPLSAKDQQRVKQQRERQQRKRHFLFILIGGFKDKTLWDYLQLLAIPLLIAFGTLWFTNQQSQATTAASDQQHQTDLDIAQDQQQETALQTYLDRMSDLLFTEHLATSQPGDMVRQVAHARTLTLLPHINPIRKAEVMQFLYQAKLIGYIGGNGKISSSIVSLTGADLSGVSLSGVAVTYRTDQNPSFSSYAVADQSRADLSGADLSGTDLGDAGLDGVNLSHANLSNVNLSGAHLNGADLSGADLSGADLTQGFYSHVSDDLRKANLSGANLSGANLSGADLSEANLSNADLGGAYLIGTNLKNAKGTTAQQLNTTAGLGDATLPDGSKHS